MRHIRRHLRLLQCIVAEFWENPRDAQFTPTCSSVMRYFILPGFHCGLQLQLSSNRRDRLAARRTGLSRLYAKLIKISYSSGYNVTSSVNDSHSMGRENGYRSRKRNRPSRNIRTRRRNWGSFGSPRSHFYVIVIARLHVSS